MDTEECIKSFGDTTTFHGVAQIIRSDSKLVKIQWVSVVIMVSMITIYQISTVITDYMNSPVAVAIDRQSQDHLHLPGIVVCPVRGLNASRLVHDGLPLHLVDIIMEEFAIPGRWLRLSNHTNYDLEINNVDLNNFVLNRNFTDFAQLLLYYSYEPEEFIHELQNENFNGKMPNYTKIFAGYNGGICFAYESNEMCSWPGMQGGFRMVLKLPPRTKYDRGAEDGWIIGVGSQVITPPTKFDKIPANSAIDIELNEISYERILSMGWPKSGVLCDNDPRHRSTSDCFLAGYSYAIRSVCNCLPFQAPYLVRRSENDTTCTPVQFNICAQKEINSILEKTQKQQKRCVPVCRETVFETTVSLNSLEKGWGNAVFGVLENMDVSYVRISFTKMEHTLYKSYESVTFSTVVSNLGGQLGLWLGASVISLIHLCTFLPKFIISYSKNHSGKTVDQNFY